MLTRYWFWPRTQERNVALICDRMQSPRAAPSKPHVRPHRVQQVKLCIQTEVHIRHGGELKKPRSVSSVLCLGSDTRESLATSHWFYSLAIILSPSP
jgi:hypothetical protein